MPEYNAALYFKTFKPAHGDNEVTSLLILVEASSSDSVGKCDTLGSVIFL